MSSPKNPLSCSSFLDDSLSAFTQNFLSGPICRHFYHKVFFFRGPLGLEVGLRSTPFRKWVLSYRSKKTNNPNPSPIRNRFGLYGFGLSLRNHYLRKALWRNGFRRSAQLFKPIQRQIGCPPNHAQAIFVLELPDGWVVKLSEQSWMMAVLQSPHGQKIEKRIPASEQRRQISDVVWVRTVIRIVMGHRQIAAFSP